MAETGATGQHRAGSAAEPGGFTEAELATCDEPVRRYFRSAIARGTPLARAARLRMRGSIKLANRWVPFRAEELLAPLQGYRWPAVVAGGLLRGADVYEDGQGTMRWKLLGVLPIIRASGSDVSRSAVGRAVAEGIWLPTALLPRYGVTWHAEDDTSLVAEIPIAGERVTLHVTIDEHGRVRSDHLDRWGDPKGTGALAWCPFGIDVVGSRTFPCGLTVPATGTGAWFHGTEQGHDGAFFRYSISELDLL